MFNFNEEAIKARNTIGINRRGRISEENQESVTLKVKSAYLDYLVKNNIIPRNIGRVAFNASFPIRHKKHRSIASGLKQFKIDQKDFVYYGGHLLIKMMNNQIHNGVQYLPKKEKVVFARLGRKAGSKNRSKEEIEKERAEKAIRNECRRSLGFPERGRLTAENQAKLDAEIEKALQEASEAQAN